MAKVVSACGEPVALAGHAIYFTSWKYVRQGSLAWRRAAPAADGQTSFDIWDSDGPTPARFQTTDIPRGVRLAAQPATKVFLEPGELGPIAAMIYDEGRYKCWYTRFPCAEPEPFSTKACIPAGHNHHVYYAESSDGLHWQKPTLGLLECAGSRANNLVFRGDLGGSTRGFHGGCVFVDPTSAAERYKMLYLGLATAAEWQAFECAHPGEADPMARGRDVDGIPWMAGVFGAVSPDGIHWQTLEEPLMIHHSDTHNTCYYDVDRGQYVAYVRTWQVDAQAPGYTAEHANGWIRVGRRSIGRAVSDDFRYFSKPEIVVAPGADMAPSHLWYTNGKTTLPGCTDQHVLFPWRWELECDGGDTYLCSSPDGGVWSPVPGGPVIARGAPGGSDGGYVIASINLLAFPGARWGIPFHGYPIPHKYPGRDVRTRQGLYPGMPDVQGIAFWPEGRLTALECPGEGEFATVGIVPPGGSIRLNASIQPTGYVQVAVQRLGSGEIPARGFGDMDPLAGDGLSMPVTWRGDPSLGHEGAPIILRFRLRQAKLFGVTFI